MATQLKSRASCTGYKLTTAACAPIFAEQAVADVAEVDANKAKILTGEVVLTGAQEGTFWGIVDSTGDTIAQSFGVLSSLGEKAAYGIIAASGELTTSGILDGEGAWQGWGILDFGQAAANYGTLTALGVKATTGIIYGAGLYAATTGLATNEVKKDVTWDDADGSHTGEYVGTGGTRRVIVAGLGL